MFHYSGQDPDIGQSNPVFRWYLISDSEHKTIWSGIQVMTRIMGLVRPEQVSKANCTSLIIIHCTLKIMWEG